MPPNQQRQEPRVCVVDIVCIHDLQQDSECKLHSVHLRIVQPYNSRSNLGSIQTPKKMPNVGSHQQQQQQQQQHQQRHYPPPSLKLWLVFLVAIVASYHAFSSFHESYWTQSNKKDWLLEDSSQVLVGRGRSLPTTTTKTRIQGGGNGWVLCWDKNHYLLSKSSDCFLKCRKRRLLIAQHGGYNNDDDPSTEWRRNNDDDDDGVVVNRRYAAKWHVDYLQVWIDYPRTNTSLNDNHHGSTATTTTTRMHSPLFPPIASILRHAMLLSSSSSSSQDENGQQQQQPPPDQDQYDVILILGQYTRIGLEDLDMAALFPDDKPDWFGLVQPLVPTTTTTTTIPSWWTQSSLWDLRHSVLRDSLLLNNSNNNNNDTSKNLNETRLVERHVKVLRDLTEPLLLFEPDASTLSLHNTSQPQQEQPQQEQQQELQQEQQQQEQQHCALLFFGLPKSFSLVFPSIRRNVLETNPSCHVYAHSYNVSSVTSRRNGELGASLFVKESLSRLVQSSSLSSRGGQEEDWVVVDEPSVVMDALQGMGGLETLRQQYYPNGSKVSGWEYPTSFDNMMKQWYSIESVWRFMEKRQAAMGWNYTRVGLFRPDVLYVNPINILDNLEAVVPWFSPMPVNDRMFYGSYHNARIWATQRFSSIGLARTEGHLKNGIHPERYLAQVIFPQMTKSNPNNDTATSSSSSVVQQVDVCFWRVRATGKIQYQDCQCNRRYLGSPFVVERVVPRHRVLIPCPSVSNLDHAQTASCLTGRTCQIPNNNTDGGRMGTMECD